MPNKKATSKDQFMAAAIGDMQWLKQSLKEEKVVSALDKNGLGAIHLAALHGRLNCLEFLVEERKVDVNASSSTGWRPIHLCISSESGKRAYPCFIYLLKKGANPSICNDDNITPAHQAASEGHIQILKLLIDIQADIMSVDIRGNKPVDLAKLWSHRECARLLSNAMWHLEKKTKEKAVVLAKKDELLDALNQVEERLNASFDNDQYLGDEDFQVWLERRLQADEERRRQKRRAKESVTEAVVAAAKQEKKVNETQKSQKLDKKPISTKEEKSQEAIAKPKETEKKTLDKEALDLETTVNNEQQQSSTHWNYCGKITDYFQEYQPNLRDLYPRDEYTLEPYEWSQPFELNPRAKSALALLKNQSNQEMLKKIAQKRGVELKQIESKNAKGRNNSLETETLCRQGMMYKCKYICDAPKKKPISVEDNWRLKSEAAIHLSSDVTSPVFQNSLQNPTKLA